VSMTEVAPFQWTVCQLAVCVLVMKLPRFRGVVLDLGDYGSVVTASIAAS
jgi:hypothetical protein